MRFEAGLDVGATLAKLVVVPDSVSLEEFEPFRFPAQATDEIAALLAARGLPRVATTGAGAHRIAERLGPANVLKVGEFAAWGAGEAELLRGAGFTPTNPHLLVSLGTGTSIFRVENAALARVGGTALGGGTLVGLGHLLVNEGNHAHLAALARAGDRRSVDLLVSDIYPTGEIALGADLTAANFGRIGTPAAADVAQAITRLVGENVGLLAGALASALPRDGGMRPDVVYAGSTLVEFLELVDILSFATELAGARARFLPHGELAGALGAVAVARSADPVSARSGTSRR